VKKTQLLPLLTALLLSTTLLCAAEQATAQDTKPLVTVSFSGFDALVADLDYIGKLGGGLSLEEGQAAARLCGINIIAQLNAACDGDLDRVARIVRLGGFVNSTPEFTDQPKVINGCSDLMVEVFGDKGRHARAAVSAASLPLGVSVEVDAVAQLTD